MVAVDSQVVLSWIFSKNIKTKCLFTRNRLKDIRERIRNLTDLRFEVLSKYVNTLDNPVYLITRGLTLDKFKSELQF